MVATPRFFGEGARSPDRGGSTSGEEFFAYGRSSDRRDGRERYRYIGVERDEDTGLCMTGPRTYDPVVGRFLQGDPAGLVDGPNVYAYCRGNPMVGRDTTGRWTDEDLANRSDALARPPPPFDAGTIDQTLAGYAEKGLPTEFMRQATSDATLSAIPAGQQANTSAPLGFMYQSVYPGRPTMQIPEDVAQLAQGTLPHESAHEILLSRTATDPGLRAVVEGQAQMMVDTGQSWSMTSFHNAQEPMAQYVGFRVGAAAGDIGSMRALREGLDSGELTHEEFMAAAEQLRTNYAANTDPSNITYGGFRGVTSEAAAWLDENLLQGLPRDLFEMEPVKALLK